MVLTRTLGAHKSRDIQEKIDRQMNLWERSIHAGLVGCVLVKRRAREGQVTKRDEEENYHLVLRFHITLMLGKLRQGIHWATDHEGGGCTCQGGYGTTLYGKVVAKI